MELEGISRDHRLFHSVKLYSLGIYCVLHNALEVEDEKRKEKAYFLPLRNLHSKRKYRHTNDCNTANKHVQIKAGAQRKE